MTGPIFLPSLNERIRDLEASMRRVRQSLFLLKHQDSSYAQDHRALLDAYGEALAVFKRHRDAAVNSGSAVLDEPIGPLCPVCCRPSWPMSENGRLWRCSRHGCPVSSFATLDEFGRPHAYNINGRVVASCAGVESMAREAFPDGIPSRVEMLRALPVPDCHTDEDPGVGILPPFDAINPEDPSHG